MAVSFYFICVLGCPEEVKWYGKSGVIFHIWDVFRIKKEKRIRARLILRLTKSSSQQQQQYDERDLRMNNRGRPKVILPQDKSLIADWIEDNMGLR